MNYWLIKSEPDCYSIRDLKKDKKTSWSGVRNYQARNFMKQMKKGDLVIFYHSSANPPSAAGIAKVCKEAHPDITALDPKDDHFDPKSSKENPIWLNVDVQFIKEFKTPVSLSRIKFEPALKRVMVAQTGSRLSVQPLSEKHFNKIVEMGSRN